MHLGAFSSSALSPFLSPLASPTVARAVRPTSPFELTSSLRTPPPSPSALRNLCIDGGYDLCAEIYNKGVLSPLSALIPQVRSPLLSLLIALPPSPLHFRD